MSSSRAVDFSGLRVAVVHDWLVNYAGSERVLEQILKSFPSADLFAVVDFLPASDRDFLLNKHATTTFVQRLPAARTRYRSYLPLMPLAIEQLDLSSYDLVLSSSHAVAKGVLTGPDQLHVSYVHSPMRYAWDLQHQYLREAGLESGVRGWIARWVLHRLRMWDLRAASGVDHFLANSHFIKRRIEKVYRRVAQVIYPPVAVEDFTPASGKEDFYLTASRMVPYKRIDLIVEAFSAMPARRLVVIGNGPDFEKVRAKAGRNTELVGYQTTENLRRLMQRAKAFVFAAEEDFGIAPVEAQACGTPVIAFGRGGVLESIRGLDDPQPTGVFFSEQTVGALIQAVERFEREEGRITADACRQNALRFSTLRFRSEYESFISAKWQEFASRGPGRPLPTVDSAGAQRGSSGRV